MESAIIERVLDEMILLKLEDKSEEWIEIDSDRIQAMGDHK